LLKKDEVLINANVKSKHDNIQYIVKNDLCTGCGTCVSFCPTGSIKMVDSRQDVFHPQVDNATCTYCGYCMKVCPGQQVDFKQLYREIYGREIDTNLLVNSRQCYLGHATNHDINYYSTSGGLITALLLYALENKIITGALVTRWKKANPFEPESFIARTTEEIIDASKSKYCPVAANLALREILQSDSGERFAVVGVACHIQGMRKAELLNKTLQQKIILYFGLMCSHTNKFGIMGHIAKTFGIKKEDITHFNFRGQGWPGYLAIDLNNGDKKLIPLEKWVKFHELNFFTPDRCLLCSDFVAGLADFSFKDAWLPEIKARNDIGQSFVVVRSEQGLKICENAMEKGVIDLQKVPDTDVIRSTGFNRLANKDLRAFFKFNKMRGYPVPEYNLKIPPSKAINYFRVIVILFNIRIWKVRYLRGLVNPLCSIETKIFRKMRNSISN
jgi:coenzyme F420 hydrogenase subunit beta